MPRNEPLRMKFQGQTVLKARWAARSTFPLLSILAPSFYSNLLLPGFWSHSGDAVHFTLENSYKVCQSEVSLIQVNHSRANLGLFW